MNIVLDNGKQDQAPCSQQTASPALVMGIGNLNFKGRGGGVFVRKAFDLIVYRNGPQRSQENSTFNASSFVADMMAKKKRAREPETIKADAKPEKQSKSLRFDDVKKRLAARKKALKKSPETVEDSE